MSLSKSKRFQNGQNMGRKGPSLNWDPLANKDYPEDGGSDASDMLNGNGDILSPLRVPVNMNVQAFLEIQTNGCCGD